MNSRSASSFATNIASDVIRSQWNLSLQGRCCSCNADTAKTSLCLASARFCESFFLSMIQYPLAPPNSRSHFGH